MFAYEYKLVNNWLISNGSSESHVLKKRGIKLCIMYLTTPVPSLFFIIIQ